MKPDKDRQMEKCCDEGETSYGEGHSLVEYCKALFRGGLFRAFAKISIRVGLIFALSHCG